MKYSYLWLILAFPLSLYAQTSAELRNYSAIDSIAVTVKYRNDLARLTNELTAPYPDKLSKSRAIFKWITENISYDYKYYNEYAYKGKEPETFKCNGASDCAAQKLAFETERIDDVLKSKKAVCSGYTLLFKKMCELADIKAEIIGGSTRSNYYQIGTTGRPRHAWNAVLLDDNEYHLLDATWAAGSCSGDEDGKLTGFHKHFNDYYWLTPAPAFARNHYPNKPEWVLIPGYTKENFAANPFYASRVLKNLRLITPETGILAVKKGDTLHFRFEYNAPLKYIQINSNLFRNPDVWIIEEISKDKKIRKPDPIALKRQQFIDYTQDGNIYTFDYIVTDESLYFMDILFDMDRVMRFNVTTKK